MEDQDSDLSRGEKVISSNLPKPWWQIYVGERIHVSNRIVEMCST